MKSAVILCNGEFPRKEYPVYLLKSAGVIVCCDGVRNVRSLERLGLEPTVIVGDMDSASRAVKEKYADRLVRIGEQDDNDLAKAFALLRARWPEISEIHILGAGGRNEAHTVGNLGWLMEWERRCLEETGTGLSGRGVNIDMVSDWSTAFAVSGSTALHVGAGRKISFFTTDPSLEIKSKGLQWPLDPVKFDAWWKATLNRASEDVVSLHFNHPAPLLVILD